MRGREKSLIEKRFSAYFTMEAASVISITLGVIVVVIYLMFFQYNRCLFEQDAEILLVRSNTLQIRDKKQLLLRLKWEEQQFDKDRYIAWDIEDMVWEIKGNNICVEQKGALRFPFDAGGLLKEAIWSANIMYEYRYISPVEVLRIGRKVIEEAG